ncbi:hypothetical protein F4553_004752 [Allocatelliglobosispora scoriae]|uniref:Uncharacterized protein n=1 Tax=Allocatelliglobosispora scoriae TaxID=643052 RepID=A0A841BWT5_9ACTN|nr:hypothetical protein [Allocatelliglobosispora scoriae]MBB5871373.1 hypothetical protein [Allocatelliglobosispora scoriae]
METVHEVLTALAERYAFGEVSALIDDGADARVLDAETVAAIQQLCVFGQRLLDLDAEDFGAADTADGKALPAGLRDAVPLELRARAVACRMPQAPKEPHRGALGSLRPAYQLLLEVIDARWRRHENTAVVSAIHIASEYAPLLVWERVLGHAGDPLRLPDAVGGEGSLWGDFDDRACPHTKAEKSAAHRVLKVGHEPPSGWQTYLDRQHSTVAGALRVCAIGCPQPCTVLRRLSAAQTQLVADGCRLAFTLNTSAIVKLRHSAPVGHGFGVPSRDEVLEAWQRTRTSLARHAPAIEQDDGFALPGLTILFSELAGTALTPATMVADTAKALAATLG